MSNIKLNIKINDLEFTIDCNSYELETEISITKIMTYNICRFNTYITFEYSNISHDDRFKNSDNNNDDETFIYDTDYNRFYVKITLQSLECSNNSISPVRHGFYTKKERIMFNYIIRKECNTSILPTLVEIK